MLPFSDKQVEVVEILGASSLSPIDLLLFLLVPIVCGSEFGQVFLGRLHAEMVLTSSLNRSVLLLDEGAIRFKASHLLDLDALSSLWWCILTFPLLPLAFVEAWVDGAFFIIVFLWSFILHCWFVLVKEHIEHIISCKSLNHAHKLFNACWYAFSVKDGHQVVY